MAPLCRAGGQDFSLTLHSFSGPCPPAKETPLGLANQGSPTGAGVAYTLLPLHASFAWLGSTGPNHCLSQSLTTSQQATPALDQCLLQSGLTASQARTPNEVSWELFTLSSFPVHREEPSLALALPPSSNIHH